MHARIDLSQLAVTRAPSIEAAPVQRRHLLTRLALPCLLLAGFAGLLLYAAREMFSPPRPVTVIPVLSARGDLEQPTDTPLFRAAGWVEPRPTPTLVSALAEGVIEDLLVVEGQDVKKGQTVARLIADDARLGLESADADLKLREAELVAAQAVLTGATARLDQPFHLKAELADAESALARSESDAATLELQIQAAAARQDLARNELDTMRRSGVGTPQVQTQKARNELTAATAAVEELQTRKKRLPVEIAALKSKQTALQEKYTRKIDEVRQVDEAKAQVGVAQARVRQAKAARDAADLRLKRMAVVAPADGRVLSVVARPGTRLGGLSTAALASAETVLTTYDPARLQVRVDVRLDDVTKVRPGQKVKIETAAMQGQTLDGEVLVVTSQADIQKNTLAIKTSITNPSQTLKPDMLCQVTFLAPPRTSGPKPSGSEPYRLLVPRQVVDTSAGNGVWVVDLLSGTARRRTVELGLAMGELVEIVSGLSLSDKPIVGGREGLQEGSRVRVVGEDETLGITRGTAKR